jgi:hypothetical protein
MRSRSYLPIALKPPLDRKYRRFQFSDKTARTLDLAQALQAGASVKSLQCASMGGHHPPDLHNPRSSFLSPVLPTGSVEWQYALETRSGSCCGKPAVISSWSCSG